MGYLAEAVGDYSGATGDPSGQEVRVCGYWDYTSLSHTVAYVYRHGSKSFRNDLMRSAVAIAKNNNIGYSMPNRQTSYYAFQGIGWSISQIPNVGSCDIDCSEMMGCCVNFAGGSMGADTWTGNIGERLEANGFTRHDWGVSLEPGDILVVHNYNQGTGHTGMYIGNNPDGELYGEEDEMVWFRFIYGGTQYLYAEGKFQPIQSSNDLNVLSAVYDVLTGKGADIPACTWCDQNWIDVLKKYFGAEAQAVSVSGIERAEIEAACKAALNGAKLSA